MSMNIEVVAHVTYTVHLTDEDMEKVKKFLKENEDNLPSFNDDENICYAVSVLYHKGEISLYDEGKATESDSLPRNLIGANLRINRPQKSLIKGKVISRDNFF